MKSYFFSTVKLLISFTLIAILFTAVSCQDPDYSIDMKPVTDKYVEAWNTGNVDLLDSIIDSAFVRHVNPGVSTGATDLDSLKRSITLFREFYPDFKVELEEEIYTLNKSVGRWKYSATHSGKGMIGLAGKKISSTGISVIHYKNGKMAEEWVESDNLNIMYQLGFKLTLPEPEAEIETEQ
jgi:predicted ester cyclase